MNRTDSNAAAGHPCVTIDSVILTRRGWLKYDQVQSGDETIGYNPVTGRNEWTTVLAVLHYDEAEVWRIGNKHWHADVTPNHRWWSDTTYDRAPETLTACPECGWTGRTDRSGRNIVPTPRSISTHRGRMHGVKTDVVRATRGEFVTTDSLKSDHRLRLAAPADTDGIPGLSLEDVRIIAWLQGDGTVSPALYKPEICPECGWLPGTGRKPHRGAIQQASNSVAVHRAKAHQMSKSQTTGELGGYDGTIWQSKPEMLIKIRALLARVEQTETTRQRHEDYLPAHAFKLRRAYVTDLMKRSQLMEIGPEAFVLALSPDQRAAWLDSMIDAEGHRQPVPAESARRGASGEFVRIAQVDGPLQEAIKLAVYLEGYRPTYSKLTRYSDKHQPAGMVGMARPYAAPGLFNPHEVLERQPVWCVVTGLGTWTMEQDGLPCLTGNSVGLLQLIPGTFAAYAGPYRNTPPLVNYGGGPVSENPMAQIYAAIHYAAANYGGARMAGVIGQGHGYANGGMITEPIIGFGQSGQRYTFGERGREWVVPESSSSQPGGVSIVNNIQLPDGASVTRAMQEISYYLQVAQQQGYLAVRPGG